MYQYFKTTDKYLHYKGRRFFKVNKENDPAIAVCLDPGEKKKGRGNFYGCYIMARQNVFANYVGPGYTVECTQQEFDLAFTVALQHMKQKFNIHPYETYLPSDSAVLTASVVRD